MHSLFGCLKTIFRWWKQDEDTHFTAPEPSTSNITTDPDAQDGPSNSTDDILKINNHNATDLWQMAHDELSESDQNTLATLLPATATKPQDASGSRMKEILDEVVKATEAQYREKGREDSIRATAHKIIKSALSFQDVISNTVKFDPTGYASSAWAIVSLDLTVCFFHLKSREVS